MEAGPEVALERMLDHSGRKLLQSRYYGALETRLLHGLDTQVRALLVLVVIVLCLTLALFAITFFGTGPGEGAMRLDLGSLVLLPVILVRVFMLRGAHKALALLSELRTLGSIEEKPPAWSGADSRATT